MRYLCAPFNKYVLFQMISRRNIRVKVMQTLYTLTAEGELNEAQILTQAGRLLKEKLEHSLDLFTTAILYTIRVGQYAEVDATKRRSKRLPTAEDMNVPTRIVGNSVLWNVLQDATFQQRVKDSRLEQYINEDVVKRAYKELENVPEYIAYNSAAERTDKEEKAILQLIWEKMLLQSEWVQEYFVDDLPGWEDDKDMTTMLMENFFKSPGKVNFLKLVSDEKRDYAHELMRSTIQRQGYLDSLIHPKLQNWDPERVAQIDFILLRMGVCEMLYFATIPTKVTINEYIDIAKTYSTPQSGQFVNGVLDNVLKDLVKEGLISKQDRVKKA
jgi:N utilization substance protein B